MRWMGIDYGERRIGIALTDPARTMALPHRSLEVKSPKEAIALICRIVTEQQVERIVVGLPLNASGDSGPMAKTVEKWRGKLAAASGLPVETVDERMTSMLAERLLHEQGLSTRQQRGRVDPIAATLILDSYLQRHR